MKLSLRSKQALLVVAGVLIGQLNLPPTLDAALRAVLAALAGVSA